MRVFVAVDDNDGMLFRSKRQSMDRRLREDVIKDSADTRLWMNKYSAEQFKPDFPQGQPWNILVDDDFLLNAVSSDNCFVEKDDLSMFQDKINVLIVYRWNRVYPSDFYLNIDLNDGCWKKISSIDFVGNSHKCITKEVWIHEKESE